MPHPLVRLMQRRPFGTLPTGQKVEAFLLENASGASLEVLTYGGIVRSLRVPDQSGNSADVVLGFASLSSYVEGRAYFGAITGRIAGRVAAGKLVVSGHRYQLPLNSPPNHIHGGQIGFDRRIWSAQPVKRSDGADALRLSYHSPDGEENYPGTIEVAVTYTLTARNEFIVESEAVADRVTPLCLTQHSYFNLRGEDSGSAAEHEILIDGAYYVPSDQSLLLSDRRESVAGTAMDFRQPRRLGDAVPELFLAHGGFYALRAPGETPPVEPTFVARAADPVSGRVLQVFTNESCLQFYTGSALSAPAGKSGRPYGAHAGFCFECQGHPEGSNLPGFDDILIHPGFPQRRKTVYAFSAQPPKNA